MPTIIIVSGPGGTGKSSGIKYAASKLGINFLNMGDITFDVPVYSKGGRINKKGIGFACGGDNINVVKTNIAFFRRNLGCLVFACRSRGATLVALQRYSAAMHVIPILITTSYPPNRAKVGNQIYGHIP
jgi:dephospho-CoA kinase